VRRPPGQFELPVWTVRGTTSTVTAKGGNSVLARGEARPSLRGRPPEPTQAGGLAGSLRIPGRSGGVTDDGDGRDDLILRPMKAFMFTDIAGSTRLREEQLSE
jgi:hypothetical protein